MFDQFDDLFLSGVFAPRELLLGGLSLEQASARPADAPHSIYQELWHITTVMEMSLAHGRVSLESWPLAEHFPQEAAPASAAEWNALVERFLEASRRAVRAAQEPGRLASGDPGYEEHGLTWRDALEFLAVHSAYHLGRIVLLRQLMGAWPPGKPGA